MPKRRCKQCKEYSEQFINVPAGTFCSTDHALEFARAAQAKQRERQLRKAKADIKKQEKAKRQKHKADKERVKRRSDWLKELQSLVNKYVRLRDSKDGCISCDKPASWQGQWHCSHYISRGHSSALRFNLWNMHKSCSVCNNYLSGNIEQYTPRLIEKIGSERYEWIQQHKSDPASYDIEYLKRAIKITRKGIKRLESRLTE